MSEWTLKYDGYEPAEEGLREALCTLGNGYVCTRGAAPEAMAGDVHYPGTYLAGVYNRLATTIEDVTVHNESLVNQPNWLLLELRPEGGRWLSTDEADLDRHELELDLRRGVLTRWVRWREPDGRATSLTQRRLVSMHDPHLAALETTVVAENWSGGLTVRSALDGRVENTLVERYRALSSHHHDPVRQEHVGGDTALLQVVTNQSHVRVAEAARTRVHRDGDGRGVELRRIDEPGLVGHELDLSLEEGGPVTLEKVVAIHHGRDRAISESAEQSLRALEGVGTFDQLLEPHVYAWHRLWERFHLSFGEDERTRRILNLHTFHTLQTVSPHSLELDAGIPARGWHGEAYRGHVFWDELFVFPYLNLRLPALSRSLLQYRSRRLPEARRAAREAGLEGAMFPWQSGSDGREESQQLHLNPRSGRWNPDHTSLQRHIGVAIAYNVWQYTQTTQDLEFIRYHGAPLLLEIARFLASLTSYDRAGDRYHICGVMGPDEYHDAYPDADEPGLDDNAYTNVMTVWTLLRARELLDGMTDHDRQAVVDELGITRTELDRWEELSRKIHVPFHGERIISQFEGYEDLEEFDWDGYRERYGDIQRLDRILLAEDDTPNRYKVSKQADALMLFYLLSSDEVREILERLGYECDDELLPRNLQYYLARTSHGSTLSGVVHSWLLARQQRERSWELFQQALQSDVADVQGGTTPEGIHLGAMAGTLDLVQRGYTGIAPRGDVLWFEPAVPHEVDALDMQLHYCGHRLRVRFSTGELRVTAPVSPAPPIEVGCHGERRTLEPGEGVVFTFPSDRSDPSDRS